ncbi:MAG: GFA family protein [Deltaproteobacteria bacterium]|nr:GFA family protein [Deltaproteobacteria bacterium]MBW2444390.1 GFA family protein [Deltaproteobacteria bacterium]
MTSEPTQVTGACLCGAVRFAVRMPTIFCGHCHCTLCQRNHGAAYVTWFAVPRAQFSLEAGESDLGHHASSDHGTRSFCRRCGSSLFCESTHHPEKLDIVLANMEDAIDRAPQVHVFFDDRAPWVEVGDDLPRLGGETGLEPTDS